MYNEITRIPGMEIHNEHENNHTSPELQAKTESSAWIQAAEF